MSPHRHRPSRPLSLVVAWSALVASLALVGCSDNKQAPTGPGGGGGSTTYSGTVSGSGVSASLTLTIATATPGPQPGPARARGSVSASGRLVLSGGGGTVDLTGAYDDVGKFISVAGGGWTVTGGLTGDGMEGGVDGPGGASGVFSVQREGSGTDTVIVVIGTFASMTGGPGGIFNFSIRGSVVRGYAYETGGSGPIPLDGTYTAGSGAITIDHPGDPGAPPLAIGTLAGDGQASGTYDDGAGEAGTWSGTRQ